MIAGEQASSPLGERSIARVDLWGKGHRVTQSTQEFQRLVPMQRSGSGSSMEGSVDRFEDWPALLDVLHKGAARSLPEQYCVRIMEHEAAVAVPHATRDAHARPSILILIAYVDIDWTQHEKLVDRICAARALGMRIGGDLARALSGPDTTTTEQLRQGRFLAERCYDLHLEEPHDRAFWEDLLSGVARFRGIRGIASPRMALLGANVVVGTRTEAERAMCDGFFDARSRRLIPIGNRLVTWDSEQVGVAQRQGETAQSEAVVHALDIRDRLERIEETVDRIALQVEVGTPAILETNRKVEQTRQEVEGARQKVDDGTRKVEALEWRVGQLQQESSWVNGVLQGLVSRLDALMRRLF